MKFGQLVRTRRRAMGMTQMDLVKRSRISRSSLIRWEREDVQVYEPELVRSVCEVLRIDMKEAIVALGYITLEELDGVLRMPDPRVDQVKQGLRQLLEELA